MLLYFQCESDPFHQDLSSLILSKFFNQPVDWDANNSGQVAPSFDTGASAEIQLKPCRVIAMPPPGIRVIHTRS
jgi:hypothetical protein